MSSSNLMSAATRTRLLKHDRRHLWMGCLGGYFALLGVGAVLTAITLRAEVTVAPATVITAEQQAAKKDEKLSSIKAQLAAMQVKAATDKAIGQHPDWSILLGILAQARGETIDMSMVSIAPAVLPGGTKRTTARPTRYALRIGGLAADHASLTSFILRIEKLSIFDKVVLSDNRMVTSTNGPQGSVSAGTTARTRVSFVIQAELDDAPATPPIPRVTRVEGKP